ncbi:hypothetical protein OG520_43415 (plasmid) [Streptomyces sp. NBC_00984]|uniref:hypothetical protein n=1 Tax=Streptomyces sp. NBC_00984 TaxID=2903700 RepID=UPI002F913530|nr:hypothetical protein OG520_43415 [Streptomyces sp. NBC_00984]
MTESGFTLRSTRRPRSTNRRATATRAFLHDLATGWDGSRILVIAHLANRWALGHLLTGTPLEERALTAE